MTHAVASALSFKKRRRCLVNVLYKSVAFSYLDTKQLNSDKNNIIYLNNNLYSSEILDVPDKVSMFFVDAGHKYEQVVYDINRIFEMNCSEECYIVFDDYGGEGHRDHVKRAVDEGLAMGVIEHVKDIGYPAGHDFGTNVRTGKLIASEGIITKIKWTDI